MTNKHATDTVVVLKAGDLVLELVPAGGGSIARFDLVQGGRRIELLRGAPTPPGADPLLYGSFPLVPFSNRIRHGKLTVGDESFSLPSNFAGSIHTIHGDGWQAPWETVAASPTSATLRYETDGTRSWWPFAYRADQRFDLTAEALVITTILTNLDQRTFPVGMGHHFYFPRAGAKLTAHLPTVWESENEIPLRAVPVPDAWAFAKGRAIKPLEMDRCFAGWDGKARIEWAGTGVALDIEADAQHGHAVIYIPAGEDFFCFEPVTNLTDAARLRSEGLSTTGIIDLAPGAAMTGIVTLRVAR